MSATKVYSAITESSHYETFRASEKRWRLVVGGGAGPIIPCTDWMCMSPFGSVEGAVVVDAEGKPAFDRPLYREAPSVNVVAYGIDSDGVAKFAVVSQPRPHADDPEQPGSNDHDPVVFGQIVMGFLAKVIGKDLVDAYESVKAGAAREIAEESGAQVILDIERPAYPWHNPNPTFVATWSDLVFVKVDLGAIGKFRSTRGEPIFNAEFIPASELMRRVRDGKHENAVYRMCTANSAWFIFFCTHPELFC